MPATHRLVACTTLICALACNSDDTANDDADMAPPPDAGPDAADDMRGFSSPVYALEESWLCRPERDDVWCQVPAAQDVAKDLSLSDSAPIAAGDKGLDCFYVYPTVEVRPEIVGQVENYDNLDDIRFAARTQVAAFSSVCNVYAPLYHQIGISTYYDASVNDQLDAAYTEIEDAFEHYLAQDNGGRDFVLIGHSQGSHMLRRLIQRRIEDDPALLDKLALALLIGPLGDIQVPEGELVGGTFEKLPLCEAAGQRGCLITYNSYPADNPPGPAFGSFVGGIPDGMDVGCTNPGALSGGKVASATYFPSVPASVLTGTMDTLSETLGAEAFAVVFRDFYALECMRNDAGVSYLSVSVDSDADDERQDPIQYDAGALFVSVVGLHLYDFSFALEPLVDLVRAL